MKFLTPFVAFLLCMNNAINCQTNNPYDSVGIKVGQSIQLVVDSINAQNFVDYEPTNLERYSNMLPIENTVSVALVADIYQSINSAEFNASQFLSQQSYSQDFIDNFLAIYDSSKTMDIPEFKTFIELKVGDIQSTVADEDEEAFLLQFCAIAYRGSSLYDTSFESSLVELDEESAEYEPNGRICQMNANGQTGPVPCGVTGAFVGGVIGSVICGLPCGIGGAIIGFIIGISLK